MAVKTMATHQREFQGVIEHKLSEWRKSYERGSLQEHRRGHIVFETSRWARFLRWIGLGYRHRTTFVDTLEMRPYRIDPFEKDCRVVNRI